MTVLKTGLRSHLTSKRGQFLECRLDGIPGWFGGIGPPGWGGPPEGPVAELVDLPARVLLEPMVPPTFWPPITQARPSARFIRGVVVVVTLRGWPTAPRPSASGVPDLGQVPKLDPGIMAFGLEPVIAWPGIDRVELDQQVRPASGGAQAPGPWLGRGCEGESRPVPGLRSGSFPVALGFGPGTAVADGVPLRVGYRHAPRRRRVAGGSGGQVAGQPRVDRPDPGELSRPVGQPGQVGQRDGQGDSSGEPARRGAGPAPSWRGRESLPSSRSRKARARSTSMSPSRPDFFSSSAKAVIR